jgi:hypothetical protein
VCVLWLFAGDGRITDASTGHRFAILPRLLVFARRRSIHCVDAARIRLIGLKITILLRLRSVSLLPMFALFTDLAAKSADSHCSDLL